MDVYVAPEVSQVETLHPYLEDALFRTLPIRQQLSQQAQTVFDAHTAADRRVVMHLTSWWPQTRGKNADEVMAAQLSMDDCLLTMSREYGFASWQQVEALGETKTDPVFERALDAMLEGNENGLSSLLDETPGLSTAQSRFGHQATLLHYLGANGVETHRQRTPLNAVAIARLLIQRGADIHAEANMYGGRQTPLALASTSAHPEKAGIADELNAVLGGM